MKSIKEWAEDDRPREKMLTKGRQSLSDAELLAILIGSGSQEESAVSLCRRILQNYSNNITALSQSSIHDLMKFKGIGEAKAISILAALELGRRRQFAEAKEKISVKGSQDAYLYLAPLLQDNPLEESWVIFLNRANKVIDTQRLSIGGVAATIIEPRWIFKHAIEKLASGIILSHNHPSGNLKPSQADLDITKKVKAGAALLDIQLLDHLIISDSGYFSFADEGLL